MREHLVTVGRVGAPHGIRGELKLQLFLEDPDDVFDFVNWHLQYPGKSQFVPFTDFEIHEKGGQYYIAFKNFHDRDQVRQFTHALLAIPRDELSDLAEGEFYWSDLEGLGVYNKENHFFGTVDHLLETGAHDVLVVKSADQSETLIPYVKDKVVLSVDLVRKKIIVDWSPSS